MPSDRPEREIRVFVSSTFRDMHAEREELIKRIFPRLRKMCAERSVAWGEVDLRWGVTAEQDALLGTAADAELAERVGRTESAVRQRRTKLGIPTCHDRRN